jgi:hypothetical protein
MVVVVEGRVEMVLVEDDPVAVPQDVPDVEEHVVLVVLTDEVDLDWD